MSSIPEERVSVLTSMLSEQELPFHWKRCDTPADIYDGTPFNVTTKVLGGVEDLLDFLCRHEVSYAFSESFSAQSEKQILHNLWVGQDYHSGDCQNNIKTKIVNCVVEIHEDDEMVAFYDAWIQDTKILIRSANIS